MIHDLSEPCHIGEHLFLGTTSHALEIRKKNAYHITHILNCSASENGLAENAKSEGLTYGRLGAKNDAFDDAVNDESDGGNVAANEEDGDIELAKLNRPRWKDSQFEQEIALRIAKNSGGDSWLVDIFDEASAFLEAARESGGRVLVCCLTGVNRSPTVAIAYLIWLKKWDLKEALIKVRSARGGFVAQIDGYLSQLVSFAAKQKLLSVPLIEGVRREGESIAVANDPASTVDALHDLLYDLDDQDCSVSADMGPPLDLTEFLDMDYTLDDSNLSAVDLLNDYTIPDDVSPNDLDYAF